MGKNIDTDALQSFEAQIPMIRQINELVLGLVPDKIECIFGCDKKSVRRFQLSFKRSKMKEVHEVYDKIELAGKGQSLEAEMIRVGKTFGQSFKRAKNNMYKTVVFEEASSPFPHVIFFYWND